MMETGEPFAGCLTCDRGASLVLLGLPEDSRSSYRRGASSAPRRIREAYNGRCYNSCTSRGVDLAGKVLDLGDLQPGDDWPVTAASYTDRCRELFREGRLGFFLGGDHAVTIPLVAAVAEIGRPVHVIQFDAHPDLYPQYLGDPHSHACVATRLLEMEHVATLTQVGIRTWNPPQAAAAERHSGRLFSHPVVTHRGDLLRHICDSEPVYVTLDIDVLDPACAPGVSHPVPGGFTFRELLEWLHQLPGRLVGMDVVEVNPSLDVRDLTSIAAGRALHEAMGVAWKQHQGPAP